MRCLALAIASLFVFAGCRDRTYILVGVEADPALVGQITELRFTSRLLRDGSEISRDEQSFPEDGPRVLSFPTSVVVVADDRGGNGEEAEVVVIAFDNGGAEIGRARAAAPVRPHQETPLRLVIGKPCGTASECLDGGNFCDAPATCNCESGACTQGFCEPIALDDDNECTEALCDEQDQTVEQIPVEDGRSCTGAGGTELVCAGGRCGCGDGVVSLGVEECDDPMGNADEPNRCRATPACTFPRCGDGIVDDAAPFFEECDDGEDNGVEPDQCRPDCTLPKCGDRIVDSGEECDDGLGVVAGNSDVRPLACRTSCALPHCGDGVRDFGFAGAGVFLGEECDNGASNADTVADACRSSASVGGNVEQCRRAFCGDGVVDTGERCDPADPATPGCNPTCTLLGDLSLLAGQIGGPGSVDGTGANARLNDVFDIAVVGNQAYFTSDENHGGPDIPTIRKIDLTTFAVTTVAGDRVQTGSTDATGLAARFSQPRGVSSDGTFLYIADTGNHKLRRMNLTTLAVETIAGNGTSAATDGSLAVAQFGSPTYVVARSATEIYVMDKDNDCPLRRVTLTQVSPPQGTVDTIAGGFGCLFPIDGGSDAAFGDVTGMVLGADGNIYTAEGSVVRQLDVSGADPVVTTIAGDPFGAPGSDDAANGLSALFSGFTGGLAPGDDEVFLADRANNVVRRIALANPNPVSTLTTTAALTETRTLAIHGTDLLLAEFGSHVLRAGNVTVSPLSLSVIAGASGAVGAVNGPALSSSFDDPGAMTLGDPNLLYVAQDFGGTPRIRRIDLMAGMVSTLTTNVGGSMPNANGFFGLATTALGNLVAAGFTAVGQVLFQVTPDDGSGGSISTLVDSSTLSTSTQDVAVLDDIAYTTHLTRSTLEQTDLANQAAGTVFVGDASAAAAVVNGPLANARFIAPAGIAACGDDLYVTETIDGASPSHVIRKIDFASGTVSTVAGAVTDAGSADGLVTAAKFDEPIKIACDVRQSRPFCSGDGSCAGTGVCDTTTDTCTCFSDEDCPGQNDCDVASGTCYDISLYVAERDSGRIRQIDLGTQMVSTLVGAGGCSGLCLGTGDDASIGQPGGLVFDPVSGTLYVSERTNNAILEIE